MKLGAWWRRPLDTGPTAPPADSAPRSTGRLGWLDEAPVLMLPSERVLLYSLVLGLAPRRVLEIGTFQGGSAMIIVAALEDAASDGRVVCVDPAPKISDDTLARIASRATVITGPSPDVLAGTVEGVEDRYDFAFVDGDHSRSGLDADIAGVEPLLTDRAYVVFHDANYPEVADSIDATVRGSRRWTDCGLLSNDVVFEDGESRTPWGGLRLLRYARRNGAR